MPSFYYGPLAEDAARQRKLEMKKAKVKTDLQVRAALRAGQERRLKHAGKVICDMIRLHHVNEREMERDIAEVVMLQARLLVLIRNQHVKDRAIADARQKWIEQGGY